jgi:PKHD-type hydroxylase
MRHKRLIVLAGFCASIPAFFPLAAQPHLVKNINESGITFRVGSRPVIVGAAGEQSVKGAAGDAVLYPAGSIHRVNAVTRGERLVAVTWVQSLVRDPGRRELLYGLNLAREKLLASAPEAEETAQVNASYLNLIRMWSDL